MKDKQKKKKVKRKKDRRLAGEMAYEYLRDRKIVREDLLEKIRTEVTSEKS